MQNHFWKGKKVLITGHEGFLGSWLSRRLVERQAEVIGIDIVTKRPRSILNDVRPSLIGIKGDICNLNRIKKIINFYKPQFIFHVAAEAIVLRANKNPLRTFQSNIQGTWNILEACRGKSFIKGIIVASSDKAYGEQEILPYREDMSLKGRHPYDVSKSCCDLLAASYFHSFQLPVCVTRCGNIYGPGDLNFSRIIPDAIQSIFQKKQFVIRSNGRFIRDYIYVEDVVNGYLCLAEKMKSLGLSGQAFNFSTETPMTVIGLFDTIAKVSAEKVKRPKILNQAQNEIQRQYLSSKKAKSILRWKPHTRLEEGLRKTIGWYSQIFF